MSFEMKKYLMTQEIVLTQRKHVLDTYLKAQLLVGDYHAVQDAASDIRDILSKLEFIEEMLSSDELSLELHPPQPDGPTPAPV